LPKPRLSSLQPKTKTINLQRGAPAATERIRGYTLTKIRERILLRDDYTCRICGHVSIKLVVDHIIPLGDGGSESDNNRQSLCFNCHIQKTAKELFEKGLIRNINDYLTSHNAKKTFTF